MSTTNTVELGPQELKEVRESLDRIKSLTTTFLHEDHSQTQQKLLELINRHVLRIEEVVGQGQVIQPSSHPTI